MSEEVHLLRAGVFTLKAKELASNEVIEGFRSSILDLEEIYLRETTVDDPVPERVQTVHVNVKICHQRRRKHPPLKRMTS
jgi:hypothetical protein